MTATAMEKMGIMATGHGVHMVMAMVTEKVEFYSPFRCHCRRSVNEPKDLIFCTLLVIILFLNDLGQKGLQRHQSTINLSDFNLLQDWRIILVRRNYMG